MGRNCDLTTALAAAGSGFGVPVMQVDPIIGYALILIGAIAGYIVGRLSCKLLLDNVDN